MRALELLLTGIAFGLVLAWLLEAFLVGRGVVSTYLAPVALILIAVSVTLRWLRR